VLDQITPGTAGTVILKRPDAKVVTLLVLSDEQIHQLAIGDVAGQRRLVLTKQQVYFDQDGLQLRSAGLNKFRVAVFPGLTLHSNKLPKSNGALIKRPDDGLFQVFESEQKTVNLELGVIQTRQAQAVPPVLLGGLAKAALQPLPESFRSAASWQISLQPGQLAKLRGLDEALLELDFVGDIGRLFSGTRMLDDWYYFGYPWQIGLKQHLSLLSQPLNLSVLPLRADAPIYLPKEHRPDFAGQDQIAAVRKVRITPVYRLTLKP